MPYSATILCYIFRHLMPSFFYFRAVALAQFDDDAQVSNFILPPRFWRATPRDTGWQRRFSAPRIMPPSLISIDRLKKPSRLIDLAGEILAPPVSPHAILR